MAPQPISLGVRSNPARDASVSAARLINCYVEEAGEEGRATLPIYACDGFDSFATLPAGAATRAMLSLSATALYLVSGAKLFKVTSAAAVTDLGAIAASGRVTMARNNRLPNAQIAIAAGGVLKVIENDVVSTVDLAPLDSGTLVGVIGMDDYLILLFDNGEFYISALNDKTYDPLDFGEANDKPGSLLGGATRGRDLMLLKARSIEFWQNTGVADFPFERTTSISLGCYAAGSIREIVITRDGGTTDSVAWAATNSDGAYVGVMLLDGYGASKISPHELDRAILAEADPASIKATTWTSRGHVFYCISGTLFSWQWDATTGFWVERKSSELERWRIADCAQLGTTLVAGDYAAGLLYAMSPSISVTAAASDLTVRHSNDSGGTWSTVRTKTIGGSANLKQRFKMTRLGQSKEDGKVLEIKISNAIYEAGQAVEMTIVPPHIHAWPHPLRFDVVHVDVVPGSSQTSRPKAVAALAVDTRVMKN